MPIHWSSEDTFMLNGKLIRFRQLRDGGYASAQYDDFEKKVIEFIRAYLSEQPYFTFYTSGSTGEPKSLQFHRDQLQKSAERTNTFFGLLPGATVICCLNPDFVAGKMMLVRALKGNLNLIVQSPSSNPLKNLPENQRIDFMALSPLQLSGILKGNPEKLARVKTVLIGGAGLDGKIETEIQKLKTQIFHSYAMTETLTHVAIRAVNGKSKSPGYKALPGVSFSQDNRKCLVVKDELLGIDRLVTNDVVELINKNTFLWKGRFDNVINSGGIKIVIEDNESKINEILTAAELDLPNCLLSLPDPALGEKMVLLLQTKDKSLDKIQVSTLLKSNLPKFHEPKIIKTVPKIFLTPTGKIDRPKNRSEYL